MPVAVGDIERVTPSEDHSAAKSVSVLRVSSRLSSVMNTSTDLHDLQQLDFCLRGHAAGETNVREAALQPPVVVNGRGQRIDAVDEPSLRHVECAHQIN